ncbi:porin [Stenotrophomonas sp. NPDC077659]|uniref:porin n=1 Tax=Stenotrophomonas sp. NPDC077659 TaxID=3390694 RepID=UPI003D029757
MDIRTPATPEVAKHAEPVSITPGEAPSRESSPLPPRQTFGDELTGVARPNNAPPPNDPRLQGFIPIPGTETAIKLGGFAKLNFIHDQDPAGNPDKLVTSSIPVAGDRGSNTNLDANATRFSFEVRRPSSLGPLRFYLENDFYGGPGTTGFRLRQAHAQVGNTYAGYGYSAFADPDSYPETLDDEGPGSESLRRVASVRQLWSLGNGVTTSLSIEDPETDIGISAPGSAEQPLPDVVGTLRMERSWGHVQSALLLRRLAYRGGGGEQGATGYGLNISGQHHFGSGVLSASIIHGRGVSRYLNDLGGKQLDAVVAPDGLDPLQVSAAHIGYTHHWAGGWRSNLVFGRLQLEANPLLAPDAFRASTYAATNLILQASPTFSWGVEILYGDLKVQDGRRADVLRVQGSIKYDFVR